MGGEEGEGEKQANCGVSSNLHFRSIYLRGKEGEKQEEEEEGGAEDPSSFTAGNPLTLSRGRKGGGEGGGGDRGLF